jgi:integrase/recombinase XerD
LDFIRHTFAVHALQQNIEQGKDIYVSLTGLMVYLGHSNITSTEYYLRLTAEVFPDFLQRADTVCAKAIPEVVRYEE